MADPNAGMTPDQQGQWSVLQQFFQTIGVNDASALSWAQGLITSGATSAQVEVQMYDQNWFQQRFPEIFLAQKNNLPPISVQDVLNYEQTVSQLEQQANLPQGFISKDQITQLMGQYNVSATELSDRITQGFIASQQAVANVPEVAQTLHGYYGVGAGGLAAYWLDPTKSLAMLQNQFTAAQIGAAGSLAGFSAIGANQAQELAAFGITPSAATSGFQSLQHMAQAYNPLPGEQPGTGLTQGQLLGGEFLGNAQDQLAMQLAASGRQAAFQGGSEFTGTASGSQGLGPATPNR